MMVWNFGVPIGQWYQNLYRNQSIYFGTDGEVNEEFR